MSIKTNGTKSIEKAEFTVLDFETTGTKAGTSRVIEIGMVKVKNLKIKNTFSSLVNPGIYIPYHITQLTGIDNSDVITAPRFEDLIDGVIDFIGDSILTAHNLPFDYSFLKSEFAYSGYEPVDNPRLCTLKLSRRLFPELPSRSLASMVKFLRLRHRNVHRALGDAQVTAMIFKYLMEKLDNAGIKRFKDFYNMFGIQRKLMDEMNSQKEAAILRAIDIGALLKIKYFTASTSRLSEREVEPFELKEEGGFKYLVGHCYLRRDERIFKLDNITKIEMLS